MPPRGASKRGSAPPEGEANTGRVTRGRRGQSSEPPSSPVQNKAKSRAAPARVIPDSNMDPELSTVHERSEEAPLQNSLTNDWPAPAVNPEDAIEELPSLYSNAEAILKLIRRLESAQQIEQAVADPGSRLNRRIASSLPQIKKQMALLGADGGYYIHPSNLEQVLFEGNDEALEFAHSIPMEYRLEDVIYKINLAMFACQVCEWFTGTYEDPNVHSGLDYNNNVFPQPFVKAFTNEQSYNSQQPLPSGFSALAEHTLGTGVLIRSHVALLIINKMANLEDFDPAIALRDVFYDTNNISVNEKTKEIQEHCPLRPFGSFEFGNHVDQAYTKLTKEWIEKIDAELPDEDDDNAFEGENEEYLEKLATQFPWRHFLTEALDWVKLRSDELSMMIQYRGGVEDIVSTIERVRSGDFKNIPQSQRSIRSQYETAPLDNLMTQGHIQPDPLQGDRAPLQQLAVWATQESNGLQQPADLRLQELHAFQSQPQRSLLDPQANGQKVTFDTQPQSQPSSSKRKRKRNDDTDEVSGDEGFQTKRGPRTSQPQSSLRTNDIEGSGTSVIGQSQTTLAQELAAAAAGLPAADTDQFRARMLEIGEEYQTVKSSGKVLMEGFKAEQKADTDRKVQERKKWSNDETSALIAYIEEFGTSWAQIQKEDKNRGSILEHRDQVALKDKARNLKFEYLKAGVPLPTNFEGVSMSKAMREKLEAWSKQPPRP